MGLKGEVSGRAPYIDEKQIDIDGPIPLIDGNIKYIDEKQGDIEESTIFNKSRLDTSPTLTRQ
ncbi:hypothetical protein [Sutcliffiella rhizosphaerae]|uniref:hypothetical protein n=1 Tax=Sutcliffiella rhizosphaerae TaxID=2880967 RepID=UPI001E609811|nr:hypothetical protein [Sutcliffiella rhizosphaerae]